MPVQTSMDLFVHGLGDLYDAEQRITQMLPTLASECLDSQVKAALEHHLKETQQQIHNLEECFRALGTPVERRVCTVMQGINQEHDAFLKEAPPAALLQLFDLGSAAKTEGYEIVSYHGLIEEAGIIGQTSCVHLLQANLMQEQAMLARVRQLGKKLSQQEAAIAKSKPIPPSPGQIQP